MFLSHAAPQQVLRETVDSSMLCFGCPYVAVPAAHVVAVIFGCATKRVSADTLGDLVAHLEKNGSHVVHTVVFQGMRQVPSIIRGAVMPWTKHDIMRQIPPCTAELWAFNVTTY